MAQLLTLAEYRDAPTAMSTQALIAGGSQPDQDSALNQVIRRATGWIETFCAQPIVAAQRSKLQVNRYRRDGALALNPGPTPLRSLVSLSVGTDGGNLTAVTDLSRVYTLEASFVVPVPWPFGASTLQFSGRMITGQVLTSYTYVSGFPNTTLQSASLAGATALTVVSAVGIAAGSTLTIVDRANTEDVTVTSVAGNVLTVPATTFAHAAGIAVHGVPQEVKEAAVLVTSALIRTRGNDALTMGNLTQPGAVVGQDPVGSADMRVAREILIPYRRTR